MVTPIVKSDALEKFSAEGSTFQLGRMILKVIMEPEPSN